MTRVRSDFLPFHRPAIGSEEIDAVVATLRSGWLTTGPRAREFEEAFRDFIGSRHAIAVSSCTAALHLALEALGVGPGDEVIVPTMTFAATAAVVLHLGATPVLVDCRADTLNLDPDALEQAVTSRTRAVIPVHFAGQPCEMDRIGALARTHDVAIVVDAAHALPAAYDGVPVGRGGDITCFSFYATKTLATGEGGMITTGRDEWADRMRLMSLHGISRDAWRRYASDGSGSWQYEIYAPGFKYNLGDLAAALGVEQLKKTGRLLDARRRIADAYDRGFDALAELCRPARDPRARHAWHLYVVQLDLDRLRVDRAGFIQALRDRNIGASVHFIPLHLHPYYRDRLGYAPAALPVATRAAERIVSLPIYPGMTDDDVADVVSAVREIVEENRR
jgi:perosamine synthetase